MDLIHHVKFLLQEGGKIALLKDKEIVVPVVPAEDSFGGGGPLVQAAVDVGKHGGLDVVVDALEDFLVVVQNQKGHDGAGIVELIPQLGEAGDVQPIGGGQKAALPLVVGVDQVAEDQEPALSPEYLRGALGLALHEPAGIKTGDGVGDLPVKEVVPLPCDLEKTVIGPDDFLRFRPEDHHGKGGVHHGILGGQIHIAGDVFNIVQDLTPADAVALAEVEVQDEDDDSLCCGQSVSPGQCGGRGKSGQEDEIQTKAGLQQVGKAFFVHRDTSSEAGWGHN